MDPEAEDASQTKATCCDRETHWQDFLNSSQRQKVMDWARSQIALIKYEADSTSGFKPILDKAGKKVPRGRDECWLNYDKFGAGGNYKWTHNFRYTCPKSKLYQVNIFISAYKLLAILLLEREDQRFVIALSKTIDFRPESFS